MKFPLTLLRLRFVESTKTEEGGGTTRPPPIYSSISQNVLVHSCRKICLTDVKPQLYYHFRNTELKISFLRLSHQITVDLSNLLSVILFQALLLGCVGVFASEARRRRLRRHRFARELPLRSHGKKNNAWKL